MPFLEIVHDLTRMAEEAFAVPERPIRCIVDGDPGAVPATVATPLAVVLNELLQNTADHAFPEGEGGGEVVLGAAPGGRATSSSRSIDDGAGLPDGLRPRRSRRPRPVDRPDPRDARSCRARSRWRRRRRGQGTCVHIRVPIEDRPA